MKITRQLTLLLSIMIFGLTKAHSTFVYSHGFGSAMPKWKRYSIQELLPPNTIAFNYQDAQMYIEPIKGIGIGLQTWKSCLGQDADIQRLHSIVSSITNNSVVLYGESRGSSAILNYLGSSLVQSANIKAAVLDSPFDCLIHVLAHRLPRYYLNNVLSTQHVENLLAFILRNYKKNGIQPIDSVNFISSEIPLLFICSQQDKEVPWKSSLLLYKKLRENNHNKVHLLILPAGAHGWIMEGAYKKLYRNVLHAFYRHYDIEHNEVYATAGHEYFCINCQPTIAEIENMLSI